MSYLIQIKNKAGVVLQEARITQLPFSIGRAADNALVISNSTISTHHCAIAQTDEGLVLQDSGSSNGTWIQNRKISNYPIQGEQIAQIGELTLHLTPEEEKNLEKTTLLEISPPNMLPSASLHTPRPTPRRKVPRWAIASAAGIGLSLATFTFFAIQNWNRVIPALSSLSSFGSRNMESQSMIQDLKRGIFEVVIDKIEDPAVVYKDKSVLELIPFAVRNDKFVSIGTAFAIRPNEFVTAAHVLTLEYGNIPHRYSLRDTQGKTYKVKNILRYSTQYDLAVFELENQPEQVYLIKEAPLPRQGESIYTIGNAHGEGISVRSGVVANFTPENESGLWNDIRYSAPASPGNSGGPLLNSLGQVVGVITMKTNNENLNYATPIDLILKLKPNTAHIHYKMTESESRQTLLETIDFTLPLPASTETLAKAFSQTKFDKTAEVRKKFETTFRDKIFPGHPNLALYLRDQNTAMGLSILDVDSSERWNAPKSDLKTVPLGNEREMYVGKFTERAAQLLIEKRKDQTIASLLEQPKELLDEVLKIFSIERKVGNTGTPIISMGAPQEIENWKDPVGRSWSTFVWRVNYAFAAYVMNCTPLPSSVACTLESMNGSRERTARHYFKVESPRYLLTYNGRLADWKTFLSPANSKWVPDFFKDTKLTYTKGKSFSLSSPSGLQSKINNPRISDESYVTFGVGYHVTKMFPLTIRTVNLVPDIKKREYFQAETIYEPAPSADEPHKAFWSRILAKEAPFNGAILSEQENLKMVLVEKAPQSRSPAQSKLQSKMLFSCRQSSNHPKAEFKKACSEFAKSKLPE